jgi:TonB-dependent SusC/RagA subfamily outer membrane receptor
VEELFVGRFPGVTVTRVPGGIAVRIREGSTIMGSGEPLFVIDGQAIEAAPGGALVGINPADIQKIEVLKDIGSTAQYGVRGANGVILITTKKAK